MKTWYDIKANAHTAEISIYDEIGAFGISAKDFIKDLQAIKSKSLSIRINSPGGSVWDGNAIYNALRRYKGDITTHIDGIAASMASVIALAGDKVEMADNALYMIHNPWSFAAGDAEDMRKQADLMDKLKGTMINVYVNKTGMSEEKISAMMDEETWLDADEAKEMGFIDDVYEGLEVAASYDIKAYGFNNKPTVSAEVEDEAAQAVVTNQKESTMDEKKTVPSTAPEGAVTTADVTNAADKATADSLQRIKDVHNVFNGFDGHRDLLDECITSGTSVNDARALLLEAVGKKTAPLAGDRIEVLITEKENFAKGVQAALEVRGGIRDIKSDDRTNDILSYSLLEMARKTLILNGHSASGSKMDIVGAAFTSTSDFSNLLANVASKSMLMGYDEAEETYQMWTRRGNLSDFKVADRSGLSLFSDLATVPENGEYTHGTFSDLKEQIQLLTYGKLFGISRQAIINDDLNAFTAIPMRMGRAARRKVGDLAYAVLTANANQSDGVALFAAGHSNLAGSGAAISAATLGAARTAMATQTDPSSNGNLNIRGQYLVVPYAIKDVADVLMASEYNPGEGSTTSFRAPNAYRNSLTVVADARLDSNSTTAWYILGNQSQHDTVEVAFLDGNDAPTMEQQNGFNVDGVEFKVRIDAAAKALEHRAMYKNAGA